MTDKRIEGRDLFLAGKYFEAHDCWEEAWQEETGTGKMFLQALIQISVALYHASSDNFSGAVSLLEKAGSKLNQLPDYEQNEVLVTVSLLLKQFSREFSREMPMDRLNTEISSLNRLVVTLLPDAG